MYAKFSLIINLWFLGLTNCKRYMNHNIIICTMWFVEIIKESLLPYEHGLYEDGFIQKNINALSSSILNLLKGREGYVALEENLRLERDGLVL